MFDKQARQPPFEREGPPGETAHRPKTSDRVCVML